MLFLPGCLLGSSPERTVFDRRKDFDVLRRSSGCSSCGSSPGKIRRIKLPSGDEVLHTYYLDGKLKRVDYAGTGQYVEYTYDAAGRRVSMFDTRLTTDTVGGQTFTWAYDKLDRMTTETYPDGSVVAWRYDALGRRSTLTDPDGRVTAYSYANQPGLKRLSTVSDAFG